MTVLKRARSAAAMAVSAVVVLLMAGCASIPTTGPVGVSETEAPGGGGVGYQFNPPGPVADAEPTEIVSGFVTAGLSPANDYGTAREFLSPQLARTWQPAAETLVYSGEPNIVSSAGSDVVTVDIQATARVDERGVKQDFTPSRVQTLEVTLAEVDGQWRISEAPNVTLLEEASFEAVFSSHPLYFYNSTYTQAVPDFRWFARRESVTATLVRALLGGASDYLADAVATAFPEGSELTRNAVPVEGGIATVDFTDTAFDGASALQRQRMQQQLELTLGNLGDVDSVRMTSEQAQVTLEDVAEFVEVSAEATVPNVQVGIEDHRLVLYQGNSTLEIAGVPDLTQYHPKLPAMSPSGRETGGTQYAFVRGDSAGVFLVSDGAVAEAVTGGSFVRPSFDAQGWLWAVDAADSTITVARAPADAGLDQLQRAEIAADWLDDSTVTSFRVSPDGARVAVVASNAAGTAHRVYIAGVVRDSLGVPRGLTEPMVLSPSVPVGQVVWDASDSVLVMQPSATESVMPERLWLDGRSEKLNPLIGMTNLSSGPGADNIVYAESQGSVYSRVSNVWKNQELSTRDLAYPG